MDFESITGVSMSNHPSMLTDKDGKFDLSYNVD